MKLTLHLVRYDVLRLRGWLLAWTCLLLVPIALGLTLLNRSAFTEESWNLPRTLDLVRFAQWLFGYILAIVLVHQHAILGSTQFWLTRPISWRRLWLTKIIGALIMVALLPAVRVRADEPCSRDSRRHRKGGSDEGCRGSRVMKSTERFSLRAVVALGRVSGVPTGRSLAGVGARQELDDEAGMTSRSAMVGVVHPSLLEDAPTLGVAFSVPAMVSKSLAAKWAQSGRGMKRESGSAWDRGGRRS